MIFDRRTAFSIAVLASLATPTFGAIGGFQVGGADCCNDGTASCLACVAGQRIGDYCAEHPEKVGCDQFTTILQPAYRQTVDQCADANCLPICRSSENQGNQQARTFCQNWCTGDKRYIYTVDGDCCESCQAEPCTEWDGTHKICLSGGVRAEARQNKGSQKQKSSAEKAQENAENQAVLVKRKTKSTKVCHDLGWKTLWGWKSSGGTFTDRSSCGASKFNGKCYKGRQAKGAMNLCESVDGRLCTMEEVMGKVPHGTGCNLDKQFVWTSTVCGVDSNGKNKFAIVKSSKGKFKCAKPNTVKSVRCCADISL